MTDSSMTVRVPGKLMIAGEFAVLEPHQESVVMAVDRYVYATLEDSNENLLSLETFDLTKLKWSFDGEKININTEDTRTGFVQAAMSVVSIYLKEKKITPSSYHLRIRSELDDVESGRKYGLGSSAAVVTGVIAAILKRFLPVDPSPELVYKLAAISHVKTQGSGSGADVAASSYGGFLRYTSFQAEWLQDELLQAETVTGLVDVEWPYFSINTLNLPKDVHMCIGWTGNPASTGPLIKNIKQLKTDDRVLYERFLADSRNAVSNFLQGISEKNIPLLIKGVKQNRKAMAELGVHAGVEIETTLLRTLCDLAEQHGGAGKPSGAGGGDCGIAFMPSHEQAVKLMDAWEEAGIKPLPITTSQFGAVKENEQD